MIYLEGKCPECNAIVAGAVKTPGMSVYDWRGTMHEFLDAGYTVRFTDQSPIINDGCEDGCSKKP